MFYNRTKNLIPYFFALIVLVGVFGFVSTKQANAQTPGTFQCYTKDGFAIAAIKSSAMCTDPNVWHAYTVSAASTTTSDPGTCTYTDPPSTDPKSSASECQNTGGASFKYDATGQTVTLSGSVTTTVGACTGKDSSGNPTPAGCDPSYVAPSANDTSSSSNPTNSLFVTEVMNNSCFTLNVSGGCITKFFYYVVYMPSAAILEIAAIFFNALISIALSSTLFAKSTFVSSAWAVVRDLSNIFFILILLFVAIQLILDLGVVDAKKTIAKVILIALLINFSMFFTQIVIDTSNILALIFYNKLEVDYKDPKTGQIVVRPYKGATGDGEKDISGSMYSGFDPTSKMDQDFWNKTKAPTVDNKDAGDGKVPPSIMIAVILVSSTIMLTAAYAFFMSGMAFVGRMIELWILIIFSPFAFMSWTVPLLGGTEYIGWGPWSKNLLKVAFMAPIFMFFMYLIFLLLGANLFGGLIATQTTWVQTLLLTIIPAALILILLMKATEYAKKGSGVIGEKLYSGAKAIGGLAMGAVTGGVGAVALGGAAALGRASVGRVATSAANSKWAQKWESHGFGGEYVQRAAAAVAKSSFDIRGAKIGGKDLAKATGLNLGKAQEGGFAERRKKQVEHRQERAKQLEVREDNPMKRELNELEMGLQKVLNDNISTIRVLDKDIEDARQAMQDAAPEDKKDKARELQIAKDAKKAFRTNTTDAQGRSIADLEKTIIPQQKDKITAENRRMRQVYAETTQSGLHQAVSLALSLGQHSIRGDAEAAHNIVMETKIDSGEKGGKH